MESLRIVVGELPRLMREIIVQTLSTQADIEVVKEVRDLSTIRESVPDLRPDVVILGCAESEVADIGSDLLKSDPRMRLLALTAEGRNAFLYQLNPQKVALGELSPKRLLEAVRANPIASGLTSR